MTRIDTRWSYLGLRALILENRALRVTVLPEVGGRIWSIIDKVRDCELLWQNPRVAPRRLPFGAVYDDVWCGGWEELFPNDAPALLGGERYPDHGETWSIAWGWRQDRDDLVLSCAAPISGTMHEKRLSLHRDGLAVAYRIENPGATELPFLFKVHAALAIAPASRLHYPAGMAVELEPEFPGTLESAAAILAAQVPDPNKRELHFFYGHGYSAGRFGIHDPSGASTTIEFDAKLLPSFWIFASYRGWRNHSVLVAEPATCHPMRMEKAIERNLAPVLAPGETFETVVTLRVSA